MPSLSKKALRKIKENGPYNGLNKIKFDSQGNAIKKTEFDSDYFTALRQGEGTNIDGSRMMIERDADIEK